MKQINGKNYYVSVGYIDEEVLKQKQTVETKDIQSIFFNAAKKSKKKDSGVAVYLDDTDKENIIAIPLIPVNEIQCKDDYFKFRVMIDSSKAEVDEKNPLLRANVFGLFEEYKKDGTQYIKHIKFFRPNHDEFFKGETKTISIEIERDIILGE